MSKNSTMYSFAEENYLKTILKLNLAGTQVISTNVLAEAMQTKASSVTDMLKKLALKKLLKYEPYKGCVLTNAGKTVAAGTLRKHRLWETFLVNTLSFSWDEVHDIAEQLEHIKSDKLIHQLDSFLGFPSHDPHGDPIPQMDGRISQSNFFTLVQSKPKQELIVCGVLNHSSEFLKYLSTYGIKIGSKLSVIQINAFDRSIELMLDTQKQLCLSNEVVKNILVQFEKSIR